MHRVLLALALLGLTACPKPTPADDGSAGPVDPPADGPGDGPADVVDGGAPPIGSTPSPDGCRSNADCEDGGVCEGQGCGDDQLGTCMPKDRMCTRDLRPYCGCDGETFQSSGSCPGQRYAAKGPCDGEGSGADGGAPGGAGADGSACLAPSDCRSGVCEGQGCGEDSPGTCAAKTRMCTRDYQAYCGCDGQTFHGSGSCPGKRYRARGECEAQGGV